MIQLELFDHHTFFFDWNREKKIFEQKNDDTVRKNYICKFILMKMYKLFCFYKSSQKVENLRDILKNIF